MKAALYARFSTDQQREASIDDQFRQAERFAVQHGLYVVAKFEDRGISGGTAERPGYQALLTAARGQQFECIVAEDISRLWRNRATYGQDSAELEDLGIHLVTCVGDDTRRDGWGLVLGIKQAIAEAQRREISYRTRRGLEGLALAGKSTGGTVYGYRDGRIYEPESTIVRGAFEIAAEGFSLAVVTAYLNALGKAPRGGVWGRSTVAAILRNPRYTGAVIWGARESKGGARDSRLRRRVMRPQPLVATQDESLRIISDELFQAAEREMTKRACRAACGRV